MKIFSLQPGETGNHHSYNDASIWLDSGRGRGYSNFMNLSFAPGEDCFL